MKELEDRRFGCKIILHEAEHESAINTLLKYFTGLKFHTFNKYRWYFRYLTAKYQVENPRKYVELRKFSYDYTPPIEEKRERLKNKIRAAKGKVTEFNNKLQRAKENHNELFELEDHPQYPQVMKKLEEKKSRLKELETEFEALSK